MSAHNPTSAHDQVVRESFTTQAQAFSTNPWITDEQRIARLVAAARLTGNQRVLDIATGPGYIAEAFAKESREVIGMDLTDAMLAIAQQRTKTRGIANISFRAGDAENLPCDENQFDVVVCRLALHHMNSPARVVREMSRVCRKNGTVLIEDIFASEHSERAAYQNRWEKLRDSAHVRALPISELLLIFRDIQLETELVNTTDDLCPELERWMVTTNTAPENAAEIRRLMEDDLLHDLSGTRPFRDAGGQLFFHARTVILAGRRVSP
ncbi:MAG: methyltransferase domain-containing protein [Acidobacteriota bacterium]|nr:methyltransferase domain-containing protein [Acidobacteriota bacterium]